MVFLAAVIAPLMTGCDGENSDVVVVQPRAGLPPAQTELPYVSSTRCEDGLEIRLRLENNKTSFLPGDTLHVLATAVNHSNMPLHIHAGSGAPLKIDVWWHTDVGWELIKEYPRASIVRSNDWKLPAGGIRRFRMDIPVGDDYPSYSPLYLVAYLNGRKDTSAAVSIDVYRPGEQKKPVPDHDPKRVDLERALSPGTD